MQACFVSATGTDVGKTFVTAALLRRRRDASAVKPVVSGFDPAAAATSDPGLLLAAMGLAITETALDRIAPWRFAAPLAPSLAAAREGRALDFAALVEFSRRAATEAPGLVLIEGVGGVMVPLDAEHTVLDWMADLALPVLLVAGSYLGTISHSLTALAALRARDLGIAALAVSETPGSPVTLADTCAEIARFAGAVPIVAVPRDAAPTDPAFARLEELLVC